MTTWLAPRTPFLSFVTYSMPATTESSVPEFHLALLDRGSVQPGRLML